MGGPYRQLREPPGKSPSQPHLALTVSGTRVAGDPDYFKEWNRTLGKHGMATHILTIWEAANLKLELFDDIHEDPGAICVKCNLATVGFTGTNGTDRSPTHRTILIRLQNDIHDLHNKTDYSEPWSGIGWTEVQCSVQLICVLVRGG